jgi:hypothetical protein
VLADRKTTVATEPARFFPGSHLNVQHTLPASGQWLGDVVRWLERPPGEPVTLAWPVLLVPELIDRRFRVPDEALQIYQRVEWTQAVPASAFEVRAAVEWISARGGSVELGLSGSAMIGGQEIARNLLVVRAPGEAEPSGRRCVPKPPDVGTVRRRRSFVISEEQVRSFSALTGAHYRVHDDIRYARDHGFPSVLVQGVVLLISQLHFAGSTGAEMWFQRAVPAGSVLELCQDEDDTAVWVLRLLGTHEVAAITRLVSAL